MTQLFETSAINGMTLANRFVRSATWLGLAGDDGSATPALIDRMAELAEGGVGLIVSGHTFVRPEGQAGPWQLGAHTDDMLPGLQAMATAVHQRGGKIVLQLAHAGAFAAHSLTRQPRLVVSGNGAPGDSPCREITEADIRDLIAAFANAARRAKTAGFDGVQIHSAHGYLLSQFLSPIFNHRTDAYGGPIENRARIHQEICRAVREAVGPAYPILIKMNCRDFADNGLSAEDARRAAGMLAAAGLDAVELSGGLLTGGALSPSRTGIKNEEKEAYFREDARAMTAALDIPLILVGGVRSISVADALVADGTAQYLSMSRPLICEPDLIKRWQSGDRERSRCLSDNLCFGPGRNGEGVRCVTRERRSK